MKSLAKVLAVSDRRGLDAVLNIARSCREMGYVPGDPGSRAMEAADAADLCIACMLPLQTSLRAEIIEGAAQMRRLRRLSTNGDHLMGGVIRDVGRAATFGAALTAMIGEAPRLVAEITAWNAKAQASLPAGLQRPQVEIELSSAPFARITVGFDRGGGLVAEAICDFTVGRRSPGPFRFAPGDMLVTTRFGLATIVALHDALRDEAAT